MKHKPVLVFMLMLLISTALTAQNIAINDNGATPDTSAMLDISSTTKGFLPPRMTLAQRNLIPSPADGLMVYSIDDSSYYFYKNGWNKFSRSAEAWGLSGNSGINAASQFIGTTDLKPLIFKVNNYNGGQLHPQTGNTALGPQSLDSNTTGTGNTALGLLAGAANKTGSGNTFIGSNADALSSDLVNATAIGANAKVGQSNSIILGNSSTKIGLGTTAPGSVGIVSTHFEIADEDGTNSDFQMRVASSGYPLTNLLASAGSLSAPSSLAGNKPTGILQSGYYSGGSYKNASGIIFSSGDNPNGYSPGKIQLYTRADSTTSVTNTFTMNERGNVGIGTATPNAPLQFSNTSKNRKIVLYDANNNDHQFYGFGINTNMIRYQTDSPGSDHVFFAAASSSASGELFRIKGNGRIGVGVAKPYTLFSNLDSNVLGGDGIGMGSKSLSWGIDVQGYVQGLYNRHTGLGGNGLSVKIAGTAANNTLLDLCTAPYATAPANSVMIVRGNGNVGINTGTPQQKLDVAGNVKIRDSIAVGIVAPHAPLHFSNALQNRKIVLLETANDDHQFFGFGINSSILRYQTSTTASDHVFYAGSSATTSNELVRIKGNGKVGISNAAPVSLLCNTNLNIIAAGGVGINTNSFSWSTNEVGYAQALYNGSLSSNSNGLCIKIANSTSSARILDLSTGPTQNAAGTSVLLVRGDGNIGINTTTPAEKLSVNGAVTIASGGYAVITNGDATPVPAGGAGTIVFSSSHFFGWNGTQWKQLDN